MVTLLAAAAGAAAPALMRLLARTRAEPATIDMSDPYEPDAEAFAGAIKAIAAEMDARPRPMEIVFIPASGRDRTFTMDLSSGGACFIVTDSADPGRTARANVRRRWICEHPVPFAIKPGRRTKLYATPVDANRFRVSDRPPRRPPPTLAMLAGSAAAGAGLVCDWPAAAAFGICLAASSALAGLLR